MIVVTTPYLSGHRITESKGMVFGLVVRSRGLGGNLMASIRSLGGGEIHEYTSLLEDTRRQAPRPARPERDARRRKRGRLDALRQLRAVGHDERDRRLRHGRRRRAGRVRAAAARRRLTGDGHGPPHRAGAGRPRRHPVRRARRRPRRLHPGIDHRDRPGRGRDRGHRRRAHRTAALPVRGGRAPRRAARPRWRRAARPADGPALPAHRRAIRGSDDRDGDARVDRSDAHIARELPRADTIEVEQGVHAVFDVLSKHIDRGEAVKLAGMFPLDLRKFWPAFIQSEARDKQQGAA